MKPSRWFVLVSVISLFATAFHQPLPGQNAQFQNIEEIISLRSEKSQSLDCIPESGLRWMPGTPQVEIAARVEHELAGMGIDAEVEARSYGEVDSCGTFFTRGVDFFIRLPDTNEMTAQTIQTELLQQVYPVLSANSDLQVGNVKFIAPSGEVIPMSAGGYSAAIQTAENAPEGVSAWQQISTTHQPSARYLHGLAYDSHRQLTVLFGGDNDGYSRLNDTWTYNGSSWTQAAPSQSPPGRANIDQAMVYDSLNRRVVLFGGLGSSGYLGDTWEFDGGNWSSVSSASSPSARDAHAMVFNSNQGKTILFGGYGSSSPLNDTWTYKNKTWTQVFPIQSPPARFNAALAYDSSRNVVVMFGGNNGATMLDDTWEYNGTTWTQIFPTQSPSIRENHGMAYDSARGVVVLFGGNTSTPLGDTWEYDGTTWKQVIPAQSPAVRGASSMVYDPQRGKMILFGGGYWTNTTLTTYQDTWEYTGVSSATSSGAITKKVYLVSFNPVLINGQRLSAYYNWNSYQELAQRTVDFFKQTSDGRINYVIVEDDQLNVWPEKIDGFKYTEAQYLKVMSGQAAAHDPDLMNYNKFVNMTQLDICGKANRGEIDEVWLYGVPYFGYYESTLVGPGSYWFNSPPVSTPYECNKMVPIMGFNVERGMDCVIEDFGHRTESTMWEVYGSWQQNRTAHNWERFALVKKLSPNYSYSGCGNIHYPPNGTSDYDYGNLSTVQTNCADFDNYPNLSTPASVTQPVTCSAWGCDHLEYFRYWYSHFPNGTGCGTDGVSNSWWNYFAHPAKALNPKSACPVVAVERAKNRGFNTYTLTTPKVPQYWVASGFQLTDGKDVSVKYEGAASVRMTGAAGRVKSLSQTLSLSGSSGSKFTLSFRVKGSSIPATGVCQAQVLIYGGGKWTSIKTLSCTNGTYAFKQRSAAFTAPSSFSKVKIIFKYSKPSGKVWFDWVSLKK